MPLAECDLLARACEMLAERCVSGIQADEIRCRAHVEASTAIATALLPALGYEKACAVARRAALERRPIRDIVLEEGLLTAELFEALVSPEAVCRLGMPDHRNG